MSQRYLLNIALTDTAVERLTRYLVGLGYQVEWGVDYVLLDRALTPAQKSALKARLSGEFFEEG